jgi:hypothetical protein
MPDSVCSPTRPAMPRLVRECDAIGYRPSRDRVLGLLEVATGTFLMALERFDAWRGWSRVGRLTLPVSFTALGLLVLAYRLYNMDCSCII